MPYYIYLTNNGSISRIIFHTWFAEDHVADLPATDGTLNPSLSLGLTARFFEVSLLLHCETILLQYMYIEE